MTNFESRLSEARRGGGILFCGAGFTADCLNFVSEEEIGVGQHLLKEINSQLSSLGAQSTFKNIQNAASEFIKQKGEHGLMNYLRDRFRVRAVSDDMAEVLRFPWERIYTTNYDNGIELSLQRAGFKANPVNNTDAPPDAEPKHSIVHLHGYIEKWDINNFRNSCVLDATSYLRLDAVRQWLPKFRDDIHQAHLVAFVGFNAADFHLNQVIFDVAALRDKVFFINRPAAEPDVDVRATQEIFGTPLYIGRSGFSGWIKSTLAAAPAEEPRLKSFKRYSAVSPSVQVPSTEEIESLFLFGELSTGQVIRDIVNGTSEYHVRRDILGSILELIEKDRKRVVLLGGDICDGKTLLCACLAHQLSASRPVYELRHPYDDILDEANSILALHPNAVLIVENCFDLRSNRLAGLARLCSGCDSILLLTSRSIAAEAEVAQMQALKAFPDFVIMHFPALNDREAGVLVKLVDQIAGWREIDAPKDSDRINFIYKECLGRLPAFQLRLLKSKYVREKYQEEYNKSGDLSNAERQAIIASIYIGHIGHDAPTQLISDAFQFDMGGLVESLRSRPSGLRLLHRVGPNYIRTVPAVGATNILSQIVADRDIVDSLVVLLRHLSSIASPNDFERHLFGQIMRYSILKPVVEDRVQVNRFFDNTSKLDGLRRQILFWLQWHIAKVDQDDFFNAEKYLDNSFAEADAYERRTGKAYDRRQLEDRRAKFLLLRAIKGTRESAEFFRDLKESWEIVGRLLRRQELTHHDLPQGFRTKDYLRDCPPNRRRTCGRAGSRTSRWWRSCGKRIVIRRRASPRSTASANRRSTSGASASAPCSRTTFVV